MAAVNYSSPLTEDLMSTLYNILIYINVSNWQILLKNSVLRDNNA
jgi:hypothetical protein